MDRASINTLMDQASAGDAAAFGEVSQAAQDELFRLSLALGLRKEDAAEATQETLLRAYADRGKWKRGGDALAWLCGIAVNVVREHQRRDRRTNAWIREVVEQAENASKGGGERADGFDAEQLLHLAAALEKLPPRQREAIACRYLRRLSIRETAEIMECAEGTVKSAVAAGLEKLQAVLECPHGSR